LLYGTAQGFADPMMCLPRSLWLPDCRLRQFVLGGGVSALTSTHSVSISHLATAPRRGAEMKRAGGRVWYEHWKDPCTLRRPSSMVSQEKLRCGAEYIWWRYSRWCFSHENHMHNEGPVHYSLQTYPHCGRTDIQCWLEDGGKKPRWLPREWTLACRDTCP